MDEKKLENPNKLDYPKLNKFNIRVTAISIAAGVILFFFICFLVLLMIGKLFFKTLFVMFIFLVLAGGALFIVLYFVNPACIYKYCFEKTENWVNMTSHFKGNTGVLGNSVQLDLVVEDDNITFNYARCNENDNAFYKHCKISQRNEPSMRDYLEKKGEEKEKKGEEKEEKEFLNYGYEIIPKFKTKEMELEWSRNIISEKEKKEEEKISQMWIQKVGNDYNIIARCNKFGSEFVLKVPLNKIKKKE
jgi:hypothetical protein